MNARDCCVVVAVAVAAAGETADVRHNDCGCPLAPRRLQWRKHAHTFSLCYGYYESSCARHNGFALVFSSLLFYTGFAFAFCRFDTSLIFFFNNNCVLFWKDSVSLLLRLELEQFE